MTGTPFDARQAARAVETLLGESVPATGPAQWEPSGDGDGEGWSGSHGAGFRLARLWESRPHDSRAQDSRAHARVPGDPGPDAAREEAAAHLADLSSALESRYGPPRTVDLRTLPAAQDGDDPPAPPLLAELDAFGLHEALLVWGPVPSPHGPRWVAVSVGQCDADAPHLMVVALSDVPIEEPPTDED
ncbi:hypothetical protein [Streptomyces sp. NPDC015131]|uniref:hypothetical protein n=1 Tax=Streptomyces sp. NPDC015131 TaxID=3364941 RepID=UPI0037035BFA